jgi:hypothetical protein
MSGFLEICDSENDFVGSPAKTRRDPSAEVADERAFGRRCSQCGSRLAVLVDVESKFSGSSIAYYSCDRCAQVVIREKR